MAVVALILIRRCPMREQEEDKESCGIESQSLGGITFIVGGLVVLASYFDLLFYSTMGR